LGVESRDTIAATIIICPALQWNMRLSVWPHFAAGAGCTCIYLSCLQGEEEEAAGVKLIQLWKIQRHCSVKQAKLVQSQQFRNVLREK